MPEKILDALTVKHLRLTEGKKEEFVGDGANLFLRLRPQSRDWLFVWKANGKKHKLMLGSSTDLSLAEAREKAREARSHIADGRHPRVEREKRRAEQFALDQANGTLPLTCSPDSRPRESAQFVVRRRIGGVDEEVAVYR